MIIQTLRYFRNAVKLNKDKLREIFNPKKLVELPLRKDLAEYKSLFTQSVSNFEKVIKPYRGEFHWFVGKVYNGQFESVDIELYYSLIRKYRPSLIIEIGSGFSSIFALEAIGKNKKGEIICIDPQPRTDLPEEIEQIKLRVEKVDIKLFNKLKANDILFIDSSHTTKEAKYHVREILPKLKSGVIIHHHDVLYPYSIYHCNNRKIYGEPDVLLNYYRKYKKNFRIIV